MKTSIERCRLCESSALRSLWELGNYYIKNFVKPGENFGPQWPLALWLCDACGLVQLSHTAPQELLYSRHYWYRSGINYTMRRALLDVVQSAASCVDMRAGDIILDIGANDGTLLSAAPLHWRKVGCEPAKNLHQELGQYADDILPVFWSAASYRALGLEPAKIVTACGMLYDLDEPQRFVDDVAAVLDDKGIFIAQLMCLKQMLDNNDLGNICHEHLEYYTYANLCQLFGNAGLEIFRVEENDVNGGSLRLYARKTAQPNHIAFDEGYDDVEAAIAALEAAHIANKDECSRFVSTLARRNNKSIHIYGASTKGNILLQYYGIGNGLCSAVSDRNPEKCGLIMTGGNIPIISEAESRAMKPSYYLVLPHAFMDEIVSREHDFFARGGKFIRLLPKFEVI